MKKLLYILTLLPLITLGQSSTDGIDVSLEFRGTTSGENDISKVQVNDTIVLGVNLNDLSAYDITFIHADIEYNKNAYTLLDPVWKINGANNSHFFFTDTKWSPNPNYDENDLWGQWSGGGGSYNSVAGWDVGHFTTQNINSFSGDYIELEFIVKNTDVSNYSKAINITMAKIDDNNQNYTHPAGSVRAHPTQQISNIPLEDFDNNVYLKVDFSSNVNPTKVLVEVIQIEGENNNLLTTLTLDANGEANVTEYLNSSSSNYRFHFKWGGTEEEWQQLKDNAITISDAVLTLKETGGFDHGQTGNAYDYAIQYLATDFDTNGSITSQDSYDLLAHVLNVQDVFVKYIEDKFESGMAVVPTSIFNSITVNNWMDEDLPDVGDGSFSVDLSNGDVILSHKTALWGDANLSHGVAPETNGTSTSQSARVAMSQRSYGLKVFSDATIDAEYNSELTDTGIKVTVKILSEDTSALQLKLDYDTTRLTFKEIVFDTGNVTTNFGNESNGRISMGSINQQGEAIPKNSTFIVIFEGNVSSAAGLISIVNTDAASIEGIQQHLKLQ